MKAFGSILALKRRSKFDHDFGMLFCRITRRGVALTCRRRASARVRRSQVPRIPPGGAPFARGESYKRVGSQAPRPKASLPKASQASQTRSNTQWARGPANLSRGLFSTMITSVAATMPSLLSCWPALRG